jgi:hypothetical protein
MERKGKIEDKKSIYITIYMNSVIGEVACQSFYWKKKLRKRIKKKKKKRQIKKILDSICTLVEINIVFNLIFLL